jgi:hypothetical protein
LTLGADEASVKNLSVSLGGSTWRGSLSLPRQCAAAAVCPLHFDLHADTIAADDLSQVFGAHPRNRPWYRFLADAPDSRTPFLLALHGSGRVSANKVVIHKLVASRVSANVNLDAGVLQIADLRGEVLGGKHAGDYKADFTGTTPAYGGRGSLQGVVLTQLAQTMQDGWITGAANATYEMSASGLTAAELASSVTASFQVEAFAGTLPHIVLGAGSAPLRMRSFTGRLLLRDRKVEVQDGKLDSADGAYEVTGTASMSAWDIHLIHAGSHGFNITGSLTEPRVAESGASQTQAALKP